MNPEGTPMTAEYLKAKHDRTIQAIDRLKRLLIVHCEGSLTPEERDAQQLNLAAEQAAAIYAVAYQVALLREELTLAEPAAVPEVFYCPDDIS